MALRIPLAPADLELGFSRLLVVGVKSSLTAEQGGAKLAGLLDGHHYTRGLALVQQATPTNNTSAAPSGYPPADPGGAFSYAVERGPDLTHPNSDGARFTRALGVPEEV